MKQINILKISIKNFLSIGNTPVIVDIKPGLHVITGINKDKEDRRNGVGKSTIADAIYFAIFGETLRELKKDFIVNNINKKTCEVILDAEIVSPTKKDTVQIIRTLDPSKCYLYINGEDKTRDSISNTNSFIMNIFDCTSEVFQNCVIMTLNNTVPFMAKKKQDKRKFIEEIFNLSVFGNMLTETKEDTNNNKRNFDLLSAKHDENIKHLESQKKQHILFVEERKKKQEKYLSRHETNSKEIQEINKNLKDFVLPDTDKIKKEIEDQELNLNKVENKIKDLRHVISEKSTLISQCNKRIESVGTDKDVCPTCLRTIQDNDRNHIKNEKQKIKKEISTFEDEISKLKTEEKQFITLQNSLDSKIQKLRENVSDYKHKLKEKENLQERLEQLNKWQSELQQDLKDLENSQDKIDSNVTSIEDNIKDLSSKIENIRALLKRLDIVKFILSEEGIKSFIVKKILQLFNSKLVYYLKKMDANCICSFNEYFEEKIIDDKGKDCSYFNFSGAERKNIDLACLFAFMDIRRLQGNVSFNFSIYDELFDSSLDEKGVELVINILKERVDKYKECAMVISHRKESIKSATGDVIFLEKNNGITRKVDYIEYRT